ncbi:MAG: pilin [Planctomycetota bacterium]
MKKKLISLFSALFILVCPLVTFAVDSKLLNPLGDGTTPEILIGRIIKALLGLSGSVALLMFVWGGFLYLTSGDSKRVQTAKDTLKHAALGLVIIFLSYIGVITVIAALTKGDVLNTKPESAAPNNLPIPKCATGQTPSYDSNGNPSCY